MKGGADVPFFERAGDGEFGGAVPGIVGGEGAGVSLFLLLGLWGEGKVRTERGGGGV